MFDENEVPFPAYIVRVIDNDNEAHQPCQTLEYAKKELEAWKATGFDAQIYKKIDLEKESN